MTEAQIAGLVFIRVAAMLALLPNLGGLFSLRMRGAMSFVLSVLIAPLVIARTPAWIGTRSWVDLAFEQMLWGAFIGAAVHVWVVSFGLAGSWIAQISGWGVSDELPTSEEPTTALGHLHGWLGGLAFLAVDGPHMALDALLNSFAAMPFAASREHVMTLAESAATVLTQSLWLALRVGSPVLTSLIASAIALAAIQRALPHVNLVRFQLAANWLVLLVALALTMAFNVDHWSEQVASLMHSLPQIGTAPGSSFGGN